MKQKKQAHKGKAVNKEAAIPSNPAAQRKLRNILAIIIAIFAFTLYAQSVSYEYTLDDGTVVQSNSLTTKGIKGVPEILKTDYWYGVGIRVPQYRPASLVMFALEWEFFPNNSHVNHFMNVLLYAITCLLLFFLLCKLFANQSRTYGLIFPFCCALLYTAHPIHTEVVDSVKSGDEILCFLFSLISIHLFIKYIEKKSVIILILASACYFIALLSKETGIAYLILIPIILFVFTKADRKQIVIASAGLAAGTCLFFLIRYYVVANIPVQILHTFSSALDNSLAATNDIISQKATEFYVLLKYILLLIYPHPFSYDYSFNQIPIQQISNPAVIISILIYFAIGIYAVLTIIKRNYAAFAILFYLLTLVPVSNIFILTGSPMSERFMYMPSLGFCMLITLLLMKLTRTQNSKTEFTSLKKLLSMNPALVIIVFIMAGIYAGKVYARNPDWKNNVALVGHDAEVAVNSAKAHYRWGFILLNGLYPKAQNKEQADSILHKAATEYLRTVAIANNYAEAYSDLGIIYEKTGQYDKALSFSDSAIKYSPNVMGTHANKGFILSQTGRLQEAIDEFQKCIQLDSAFDLAYKNIGICYRNLNQNAKAIAYLSKAYQLDPTDIKNINILATAYNDAGDTAKAKQYFEKANQLKAAGMK